MKTHTLFKLIIMIVTILQTYAMELIIFSQDKKQHTNQLLPDEIWDKIIAWSPCKVRKNLKETCEQLAHLTSVSRLDTLMEHNFIVGDRKDQSALFTAIIKTSNPQLITTIMQYAYNEARSWYSEPDAVCIELESFELMKKECVQKHATSLLKIALKEDNAIDLFRN